MESAPKRKRQEAEGGKKPKLIQATLFQRFVEAKSTTVAVSTNPTRIVSWNVNGLRAFYKKQARNPFLQRTDFDVLCLNETKLQDDHVTEFRTTFSRFRHQYWTCSQAKKGYSGVCILSKVPAISVKYGISEHKHDQEGRVVTAEFPDFFLVASYIPNSGKKLCRLPYRVQEWDSSLRVYLKSLESCGKGVVWIGDLNVVHQLIDIHDMRGNEGCSGCSPEERGSFNETLGEGFVDSFRKLYPERRKYSWFSVINSDSRRFNHGWRLDYAVVSESLMNRVQDSIIHDTVEGSDHCPIELVLGFPSGEPAEAIN